MWAPPPYKRLPCLFTYIIWHLILVYNTKSVFNFSFSKRLTPSILDYCIYLVSCFCWLYTFFCCGPIFFRITKQTLALLAGLRTASNSSCRRSCPILTIHLRSRLLVKLRESGGRFRQEPPTWWNVTKDEIEKMWCYQKAPFLPCYVLNLMDLYNFSGQLDFTLLLVFQGIASPQRCPVNFLIGELSKFNQITFLTEDWPLGRFFNILRFVDARRILVWLLSNMSIDSFLMKKIHPGKLTYPLKKGLFQ